MRYTEKIPKFIIFFFVCDFMLILLHLLYSGFGPPIWKLTVFFDIDGESNLPTWYSSIQLLVISIFFFVFAREKVDGKDVKTWFLAVFPAVFAALSLDEVAQIHEWIGFRSDILLPGGSRETTLFHKTGIWMFLIGIPFIIFMIRIFYSLNRYLKERRGIMKKFIFGLILFLSSVLGIEALSNFVSDEGTAYMILQCLEELGEMVGATFILWATYDLLLSYDITLQIPPPGKKET